LKRNSPTITFFSLENEQRERVKGYFESSICPYFLELRVCPLSKQRNFKENRINKEYNMHINKQQQFDERK
jgi:hypothetical protein